MVAASAGSAVDLSDLADDHHAIDTVLARCRDGRWPPSRWPPTTWRRPRSSPAP